MNNRRGVLYFILILSMVSILAFYFNIFNFNTFSSSNTLLENLNPTSENTKMITTYCFQGGKTFDEKTKEWVINDKYECKNNVVFNNGLDVLVANAIANGTYRYGFNNSMLCNASGIGCAVQVAAQNTAFTEMTECNLTSKQANLLDNIVGTGNYSMFWEWTCNCTATFNATKIHDPNLRVNLSGTDFTARTCTTGDVFRQNVTIQFS